MVHDTEQLLAAEKHHDEDADVGKYNQLKDTEVHKCKKHGILCRILTALHLKKRSKKYQDHQKLLSESQEQLARSTSKKKRKKSKTRATAEVESESTKVLTVPRVGSNRNNNNTKKFATTYEKLDNISINSEDLVPVDLDFWEMDSATEDPQLPHEILRSVHMYGDDRFGECQIDRAQNKYAPLNEKERTESLSAGDYLKHQWKGKRAKKARKGIRTVMKATWQSFQNGVGSQATFMSPQGAISSAIASGKSRRS